MKRDIVYMIWMVVLYGSCRDINYINVFAFVRSLLSHACQSGTISNRVWHLFLTF